MPSPCALSLPRLVSSSPTWQLTTPHLPRSSRRTLDTHLAIGLAHLDPPTHHLRALRLLDTLLISSPTNAPAVHLLKARAYVLQYSEKWLEAVKAWDLVLASSSTSSSSVDTSTTDDDRTAVIGERAWCLFSAGQLDGAREGLEEVVRGLEARKVVRDEERGEQEKARSKAGVERADVVEEGETLGEAEERAQAWWRLGQCLWALRGTHTHWLPDVVMLRGGF